MLTHNKKKGFSFVEVVTVIAIMVVLLAILIPSLLSYTEKSRMQKDESAMDEVCNAIELAISDAKTFDEVCSYAVPNNYITYTDSSGVYGQMIKDEEFWAPDGSGRAVTITFNPDENGNYVLADGLVNDMTYGNGSIAENRVAADELKQCWFKEMGDQLLFSKIQQTIGTSIAEKSVTYRYSSFTVFIVIETVNGEPRPNIYGEFNGTNLSPDSLASLGSGTSQYDENKKPIITKPEGGKTESNYTNSDLQGSGHLTAPTPNYKKPKPLSTFTKIEIEGFDYVFHAYCVWSDGTNTYYSEGSPMQYKWNGNNWEPMKWGSYQGVFGSGVWTDGEKYYYSSVSVLPATHKVLNGTTWSSTYWSGTDRNDGSYMWNHDGKTYYSYYSNQYVLQGTKWVKQKWSGLTSFMGNRIWTDGKNTYCSDGATQYVLKENDVWEKMEWKGLTNFYAGHVWSDNKNIYYSYGTEQYILNGNTWEPHEWNGLTNFNGGDIWTDGTYCYYKKDYKLT